MSGGDEEQEVTLEQALELGLQHHQRGDLATAESIYSQILEVDPENPTANHYYGILVLQSGDAARAIDLFDAALKTNPDFAEAHNNRGLALQQAGRASEAAESFEAAIANAPNFADAYVNLGSALDDQKRYLEAIAALEKALVLAPDHADGHNDIGLVLHKLVRFEEAILHFEKAITLAPDFGEAYSNLGSALIVLERDTDALAAFEKALEFMPQSASAHFNLGNALQKLGRLHEAVEAFEAAKQRKSSYRVLHCLYALDRRDEFRKKLDRLLQEDQTDRAVAAVSAFAAHQWRTDNPYPFCRNPLDYVRVRNVMETGDGRKVIEDLKAYFAEGGYQELPNQGHITEGRTSFGNLFEQPHPSLDAFRDLIDSHVTAFRDEYADAPCTMIEEWPDRWRLDAWYLKIRKGGQVDPHIHDPGWLSGTLYLNIPDDVEGEEGSIAFGLQGDKMPVLDESYPQKVCRVRTGDLVLFPASLFHRVLPFNNEEERLCVAYDVIPVGDRIY